MSQTANLSLLTHVTLARAFSNVNQHKHEDTGAQVLVQVTGFNLRKWMAKNSKKVPQILEALGQLVAANKLKLEYTE